MPDRMNVVHFDSGLKEMGRNGTWKKLRESSLACLLSFSSESTESIGIRQVSWLV
ncbi:hypothetical protein [Algoriphagus kandeliae]|uniref:hypothetical protein n=1 Tax=Algoriphagus kandeliae TaxID=2562278 RepID=UPI0013875B57|nr:hypothetical protein [Algoriphagus kandeliae]